MEVITMYKCDGCDHAYDTPDKIQTCKICGEEFCDWCKKEWEKDICEDCGPVIETLREWVQEDDYLVILNNILVSVFGENPYKIK
jgi:rRNA maturation endonuclease Nob1